MINALKYAVPLARAAAEWAEPELYKKSFERHLKFMKATVEKAEKAPEMKGVGAGIEFAGVTGSRGGPARAEGAELRALRRLLDSLDPDQNWGGLRRTPTPEGHYLWLCKYHFPEYR